MRHDWLVGWFSLFPKSFSLRSASFGLDSASLSVWLHVSVQGLGGQGWTVPLGNSGNLHKMKVDMKV